MKTRDDEEEEEEEEIWMKLNMDEMYTYMKSGKRKKRMRMKDPLCSVGQLYDPIFRE